MNGTITPAGFIPVDDLLFGSTDVKPVEVEDWDASYDEDHERIDDKHWVEAFEPTDHAGNTWRMINSDEGISKLVFDGHMYGRDEYWDFEADWTDRMPGIECIDGREYDDLFDINAAENGGSEGPMMSYWYPCHVADDDSAITLIDLPLCVVYVDGVSGLALTGGGQDHSWEIIEAFCRLGQMPPVHFARDLPAMAGRGESVKDRYLIDASVRAMDATIQSLSYSRGKLADRFNVTS